MANKTMTFGQNTTNGVDIVVNGSTTTEEVDTKKIVVSTTDTYGTSLPASGKEGQIFFKVVS